MPNDCRPYAGQHNWRKVYSSSNDTNIPCLCYALGQLLQVPQQAPLQLQQRQQPQHCLQLPALLQGLLLPFLLLQPLVVLGAPAHSAIQIQKYIAKHACTDSSIVEHPNARLQSWCLPQSSDTELEWWLNTTTRPSVWVS